MLFTVHCSVFTVFTVFTVFSHHIRVLLLDAFGSHIAVDYISDVAEGDYLSSKKHTKNAFSDACLEFKVTAYCNMFLETSIVNIL